MQDEKASVWRYAPIALVGGGLVLAYAFGVQNYLSLDYLSHSRMSLKSYVDSHFLASILGFVLFYTVAILFVFPAPVILTVAAGFLFGWWTGGLIAIAGATVGGSLLFVAARSAFEIGREHV